MLVWHVERALLTSGWAKNVRLGISDGRICRVETDQAAQAGDVRIGTGLPAVGNLHSHAFQRAMAGLTEISGQEGDSFWSWRQLMYRFVAAMSPDQFEAVAAYAFMEMIEGGFCRVGEFHYLHHDPDGEHYADQGEMASRLAAAADLSGIALTLLPVFYAHGGFGGRAPGDDQRRFLSDPDSYARLIDASRAAVKPLPDGLVGIAPHSLRAVTPDELAEILPLAGDAPVHIHIAEQIREVEDCLAWSGARPVAWLLDNMPVTERWCLVHATHLDEREVIGLAGSGAVAGLCPITEANLGDGLFPARAYMDAGGRIGVGSDSNVRIDMTEELRLLEYGQRLSGRSRNVMGTAGRSTGRTLLDLCVDGGARALGVEGGLAVNRPADMIVLNPDGFAELGRDGDAIADTLLFSTGQRSISEIWRGGQRIVVDGQHRHRDAIEARYRRVMKDLLHS